MTVVREERLDADPKLRAVYEHEKANDDEGASKKPYRFIEDYSLVGAQVSSLGLVSRGLLYNVRGALTTRLMRPCHPRGP